MYDRVYVPELDVAASTDCTGLDVQAPVDIISEQARWGLRQGRQIRLRYT